jgi:peptide chain release factor 3
LGKQHSVVFGREKQKVGESLKIDDINDPSIDEVIGEKAAKL